MYILLFSAQTNFKSEDFWKICLFDWFFYIAQCGVIICSIRYIFTLFLYKSKHIGLRLPLLNNCLNYPVQLKTTSPEKFRVKPSTGCLAPGETTTVTVTLLQGFQLGGLSRDKFLVMSTQVDPSDVNNLDLSELWKVGSFYFATSIIV